MHDSAFKKMSPLWLRRERERERERVYMFPLYKNRYMNT